MKSDKERILELELTCKNLEARIEKLEGLFRVQDLTPQKLENLKDPTKI